jgi:uncharacterized protein YifN (PemK superfamily)
MSVDDKTNNSLLQKKVNILYGQDETNPLKKMIVEYVGGKLKPENDEVTLEMVVNELANEFEELVLPLAEENWIRGYHQAMEDVTEGEKLYQEQLEKHNNDQDDKE